MTCCLNKPKLAVASCAVPASQADIKVEGGFFATYSLISVSTDGTAKIFLPPHVAAQKERDDMTCLSLSGFKPTSVSCRIAPDWGPLKDALPFDLPRRGNLNRDDELVGGRLLGTLPTPVSS